eukprot:tig00000754_g3910.t1
MVESEAYLAALNAARRRLSGVMAPTPPKTPRRNPIARLPGSPSMRLRLASAEGTGAPPLHGAGSAAERLTPRPPPPTMTFSPAPSTSAPRAASADPSARRPSVADAYAAAHARHLGDPSPPPAPARPPRLRRPPRPLPADPAGASRPASAAPAPHGHRRRSMFNAKPVKKKGAPKADSWWVDEGRARHVIKYWGDFNPELLMQGRGEFAYDGGDRYVGEWREGKKHGRGSLYYGDGYSSYVGEWREGTQNGRGRFVYGDAAVGNEDEHCKKYHSFAAKSDGSCGGGEYEGMWKDGKKHGHGVLRWGNFSGEFSGPLANDYSPESLVVRHARKRYAFGAKKSQMEISRNFYVYVGDWDEDERHGRGVYTDIEGNSYEGAWHRGLLHGRGVWRGAFGDSYEGDFANNRRHGRGRYANVDGSVYEGPWWNDKRHGLGKYTFPDGVQVEAWFEEDKQAKFGRLLSAPAEHLARLHGKRTVERRAPPSEPLRLIGDIEAVLRGWWLNWARRAAAAVKAAAAGRPAAGHGHGTHGHALGHAHGH